MTGICDDGVVMIGDLKLSSLCKGLFELFLFVFGIWI